MLKVLRYNNAIPIRHFACLYDLLCKRIIKANNITAQSSIFYEKEPYHLSEIKFYPEKEKYDMDYLINFIKTFYYRKKWAHVEIYNSALELQNLIQIIPINNLKATEIFHAGAIVHDWDYMNLKNLKEKASRIEIDLLIDDLLLDIKLYDEIQFTLKDIGQLLYYYIILSLVNIKINFLGLFFARHGYIKKFGLDDLFSENDLNDFQNDCINIIKLGKPRYLREIIENSLKLFI